MRLLVFCLCLIYGAAHAEVSEVNRVKTLTLDEAIVLSVRQNPNVQINRLDIISNKFALWVAQWEFLPHYSVTGKATFTKNTQNKVLNHLTHYYDFAPGVTLKNHIGTTFTLSGTNTDNGQHYNPGVALTVTQPLMRGFGKPIVDAALNDALDSDRIKRMSIESTLRMTVTDVINNYLDVVSAQRTIRIDEDAVKRAELSVKQTGLFIKAGHKAGNELISVKANAASTKAQLENDKLAFDRARHNLLTAIGLDPNMPVKFASLDVKKLIAKYHLPDLSQTKNLAMENDTDYQASIITLNGSTQRQLMIAKDNARWQLDASATLTTGNGSGGGYNAGTNSLWNGFNQGRSVGLTLNIPIDDQRLKQSVLDAQLAIKRAQINLQKDRWRKETEAINNWNSVKSSKERLSFAEDAEVLQKQTYHVNYQKYLHGLIDSLELQQAQKQLIDAQNNSLNATIDYLKALVNIDQLTGHTLTTWNIPVRY